jgi:CHU_C Type IX secretion signal domain
MKPKVALIIVLVLIAVLAQNCTDKVIAPPDYYNTCMTTSFYKAGAGNIFIPTAFSPNNDGLNDNFDIMADSNIKCITNIYIRNKAGDILFALDTILGPIKNGSWDGLINNTGTLHLGYCTVACTVLDKNNATSFIKANTCSFDCKNAAFFGNRLDCIVQDQWRPTDTLLSISKDNCFK